MGGFGSGKGVRYKAWRSRKPITTNLPNLNIPHLIKLHKANPGSMIGFGTIRFTLEGHTLHLGSSEGEQLRTKTIKITEMPCHLGGSYYMGYCPYCQRRVKILYQHKTAFACRCCFKMGYASQNDTLARRLYDKRKKTGVKINNNEWTKPKWMRQHTFARLRREYFDLQEKSQLADIFSLRNMRAVNAMFEKYPMAIFAAEELMEKYGHY